ncbi:hypothetical protein BDV10DRAFT_133588 [Aspergillus recurvatus]
MTLMTLVAFSWPDDACRSELCDIGGLQSYLMLCMKVKIISWNGCVISRCILQTVCWSFLAFCFSSFLIPSLRFSCRLQTFYYCFWHS